MNLYFTPEILNCLDQFSTPMALKARSGSICNDSIQFQMKIRKLTIIVCFLQTMQNLVILQCCLAEDGYEMCKDFKCMCTAIVLLMKPFVLWRSCCSPHHGLLKLPTKIREGRRRRIIIPHLVEAPWGIDWDWEDHLRGLRFFLTNMHSKKWENVCWNMVIHLTH